MIAYPHHLSVCTCGTDDLYHWPTLRYSLRRTRGRADNGSSGRIHSSHYDPSPPCQRCCRLESLGIGGQGSHKAGCRTNGGRLGHQGSDRQPTRRQSGARPAATVFPVTRSARNHAWPDGQSTSSSRPGKVESTPLPKTVLRPIIWYTAWESTSCAVMRPDASNVAGALILPEREE